MDVLILKNKKKTDFDDIVLRTRERFLGRGAFPMTVTEPVLRVAHARGSLKAPACGVFLMGGKITVQIETAGDFPKDDL